MQLKVLSRNFPIIELAQQGLQQVVGAALRIENECRAGRLAISLQDLKQQRGLPHARFRDQRAESQVALYAVNERSQRLAVSRTGEKKARVGSHSEGLFTESEVLQEHRISWASPLPLPQPETGWGASGGK